MSRTPNRAGHPAPFFSRTASIICSFHRVEQFAWRPLQSAVRVRVNGQRNDVVCRLFSPLFASIMVACVNVTFDDAHSIANALFVVVVVVVRTGFSSSSF